jgi:hypothetical protein
MRISRGVRTASRVHAAPLRQRHHRRGPHSGFLSEGVEMRRCGILRQMALTTTAVSISRQAIQRQLGSHISRFQVSCDTGIPVSTGNSQAKLVMAKARYMLTTSMPNVRRSGSRVG